MQLSSQAALFADAAAILNPAEPNPDNWQEDKGFAQYMGTGNSYYRSPTDMAAFATGDSRSVPRHGGRVNVGFFDGHAQSMKNSALGYNLLRTDPGALWARDHNSLTCPVWQ